MKMIRLADPLHEAAARILLRCEPPNEDGCWIWAGTVDGRGYGKVKVRKPRREMKAHRIMYEVIVGPIPDGLEIDHLCRTRRCVNPAHLEAVTHRENVRRGEKATRTHCERGKHPLSGDNLVIRGGRRACRECDNARRRRRRVPA